MINPLEAILDAKRIRVIGISGAGKSTLSRKLGAILDLPVIHMDVEFWQPGWVEPDKEIWHAKIAELAQRDQWIMDGNFGGSMQITMPPADAIIHLTCNTIAAIWGITIRRFQPDWRTRSDLAEGCVEQLDPEFFKYVWTFNRGTRATVEAHIAEFAADKPLLMLNGRADARRLVRELQNAHPV